MPILNGPEFTWDEALRNHRKFAQGVEAMLPDITHHEFAFAMACYAENGSSDASIEQTVVVIRRGREAK